MSFLKAQNGQPVESPKTTLNPKVEAYNRAMAKESFSTTSVDLTDIMTFICMKITFLKNLLWVIGL